VAALEAGPPPSTLPGLLRSARAAGARAAAAYLDAGGGSVPEGLQLLRSAQWQELEQLAPVCVAGGGSPMLPALAAWRLLSDEPWRCPRHRWEQGERLARCWDRIAGRPGAGAVELMWETVDHLDPGGARLRRIGARLADGRPVDRYGRPAARDGGTPKSLTYMVILLKRRVRTAQGRRAKAGAWS